jgi:hypothetical protein
MDTWFIIPTLIYLEGSSHLLPGKSYWRGRLGTVDLLVLTSIDKFLFILKKICYHIYKTSYLYEEVNCTKPSPSVSISCCYRCYICFFLHNNLPCLAEELHFRPSLNFAVACIINITIIILQFSGVMPVLLMFSNGVIDDSRRIIDNSVYVIDYLKWCSKLWRHSLMTLQVSSTIVIFLWHRPPVGWQPDKVEHRRQRP